MEEHPPQYTTTLLFSIDVPIAKMSYCLTNGKSVQIIYNKLELKLFSNTFEGVNILNWFNMAIQYT